MCFFRPKLGVGFQLSDLTQKTMIYCLGKVYEHVAKDMEGKTHWSEDKKKYARQVMKRNVLGIPLNVINRELGSKCHVEKYLIYPFRISWASKSWIDYYIDIAYFLVDDKKYIDAGRKLLEIILSEDPDNVEAMHRLHFSYSPGFNVDVFKRHIELWERKGMCTKYDRQHLDALIGPARDHSHAVLMAYYANCTSYISLYGGYMRMVGKVGFRTSLRMYTKVVPLPEPIEITVGKWKVPVTFKTLENS